MQAIRDVKQDGRIGAGNGEYLEQSGLSTTAISKEIALFLKAEDESGVSDTSLLHQFLDEIAQKYEGAVIQQAEWLGFDPNVKVDFTYEP